MKYKIGDKVKVIGNDIFKQIRNSDGEMDRYIGKICVITSINKNTCRWYLDNKRWTYPEDCLKLVESYEDRLFEMEE